MDWYKNLKNIQVEFTSFCNALCPGCERTTDDGKFNKNLAQSHMTEASWRNVIKNLDWDLNRIVFNGAVGDFCMHPDGIPLLDIFIKAQPTAFIDIATNGGARTPEWWSELGNLLKDHPHEVHFSIEGVTEQAHSRHRRNVKLHRLLENAQAFINAGGNALAVYTLFDHNVDEWEDCKDLCERMGFVKFSTRTNCVNDWKLRQWGITLDRVDEMQEQRFVLGNIKFDLEETKNTFEEFPPCGSYLNREIMIDWRGFVYPCSHHYSDNVFATNELKLVKSDGSYDIFPSHVFDLNNHTLKDILQNKFFTEYLRPGIESQRWIKCNQQDCMKFG